MSTSHRSIDHDALFKRLITEFAFDFIRLFFPKVASQIQAQSLVLLDKELLGKGKRRYRKIVDLALRATLLDGDAFFIVHIEHESSTRRLKKIHQRMALYALQLYELYELPVYPILLTSFDKPKTKIANQFKIEAAGDKILQFKFQVIQLNRLDWRQFLRNDNPVATALMAKMDIAPKDRIKVKLACLRMLATLTLDYERIEHIAQFIDVYLSLNEKEEDVFMQEASKIAELQAPAPLTEIITSWERRAEQRGKQVGLIEGEQRGKQVGFIEGEQRGKQVGLIEGEVLGRQTGLIEITQRQLQRRLGEVPSDITQQLRSLNSEQLGNFAEALLDFTNVAQVREWLAHRNN
ncbi:MAG: Rpn family recombination-promoting nuclease/putative transposase [Anaerolineae bacterium]|nr:Rpn family recombination-promoting nuclease/putative transposase [Anaerolineae bacterium]